MQYLSDAAMRLYHQTKRDYMKGFSHYMEEFQRIETLSNGTINRYNGQLELAQHRLQGIAKRNQLIDELADCYKKMATEHQRVDSGAEVFTCNHFKIVK